jgi:hypothetical protein
VHAAESAPVSRSRYKYMRDGLRARVNAVAPSFPI